MEIQSTWPTVQRPESLLLHGMRTFNQVISTLVSIFNRFRRRDKDPESLLGHGDGVEWSQVSGVLGMS